MGRAAAHGSHPVQYASLLRPTRVDLIVSGDRDLLMLKSFREIPIVTAAEAVRITSGQ
jgi:predicted nucleic acid-binding protein